MNTLNVIVLGMHRSGTSAVAGALRAAGLHAGPVDAMMTPRPGNPSGFAELLDVMAFNDRLLDSLGWRWDAPDAAPQAVPPDRPELVDEGRRLVESHLAGHEPWVLKDPRISLLMPWWRRILLDRFVTVVAIRDPDEVAWSLTLRNGMNRQTGLALWAAYHRHMAAGLEGLPVVVVKYDALAAQPRRIVPLLLDAIATLGVSGGFDPDPASDFVRPVLRRPTQAGSETPEGTSLKHLHAAWLGEEVHAFDRFSMEATLPADWEDALLGAHRSSRVAEAQLDETRSELAESHARLEGLQKLRASLTQNIAEMTATRSELQSELGAAQAERGHQAEVIQALEVDRDRLTSELGAAQAERGRQAEVVQALEADLAAALGDGQQLRAVMAGRRREAARLSTRLSRREATLGQVQLALDERRAEVAHLKSELDLQSAEVIRLKETLTGHEIEFARLSEELHHRRDAIDALRSTLEERDGKLHAIEAALTEERAERGSLQQMVTQGAAEVLQLQATVTDRNAQVSSLKIEVLATTDSASRLRLELAERSAEVRRLEFERDTRGEAIALSSRLQSMQAETIGRLASNVNDLTRNMEAFKIELDMVHAPLRRRLATSIAHQLRRLIWKLPFGWSNPLLDESWYVTVYPDIAVLHETPQRHYRRHGVREGRNPNRMFDTSWYLSQNPDVAHGRIGPLDHYWRFGADEGRDPHPDFDTSWYLENNPDVRASRLNPLLHYLVAGHLEGRATKPPSSVSSRGETAGHAPEPLSTFGRGSDLTGSQTSSPDALDAHRVAMSDPVDISQRYEHEIGPTGGETEPEERVDLVADLADHVDPHIAFCDLRN